MNPMLAGTLEDLSDLRFPVLASPKIDGIRVRYLGGVALSRSMKPLKNKALQAFAAQYAGILEGLDGEIICGSPTDKKACRYTTSVVNSYDKTDPLTTHVFDHCKMPHSPFDERLSIAGTQVAAGILLGVSQITLVEHVMLDSMEGILAYENDMLALGYEGIMTRTSSGLYKTGRSTPKEQGLIKIKRFVDDEAIVIGVEEKMHNANEAVTNELGRTSRSSHKENQIPTGMMGALVCRGLAGRFKDVEFKIGTGFDREECIDMWKNPPIGKMISYQYFPIGVKDKPRILSFKCIREEGT